MAIPQEELKTLIQTDSPATEDMDVQSLKTIANSKQDLTKLKESMNSLLDAILSDQSMLTKAASSWGEVSNLKRFAGGATVVLPPLIMGIAAHATVLLTLSGVSVVGLPFISLVLDEHYEKHTSNIDKIKNGIFSFVSLLDGTINALEDIRVKFSNEVERFKNQNRVLKQTIKSQIIYTQSLSEQVASCLATERKLESIVEELELKNQDLQTSSEQNSQLLEANQKELAQVKKEYEISQLQLSDKVKELDKAQVDLESAIERAKKIAKTLQGTVTDLQTVSNNKTSQTTIEQEMSNLVDNVQNNFDKTHKRFTNFEKEFETRIGELVECNEKTKKSAEQFDQIIEKLEVLGKEIGAEQSKPNNNLAKLLNTQGMFKFNRLAHAGPATQPILAM